MVRSIAFVCSRVPMSWKILGAYVRYLIGLPIFFHAPTFDSIPNALLCSPLLSMSLPYPDSKSILVRTGCQVLVDSTHQDGFTVCSCQRTKHKGCKYAPTFWILFFIFLGIRVVRLGSHDHLEAAESLVVGSRLYSKLANRHYYLERRRYSRGGPPPGGNPAGGKPAVTTVSHVFRSF